MESELFSLFTTQVAPWVEKARLCLNESDDYAIVHLGFKLGELTGVCQLIGIERMGAILAFAQQQLTSNQVEKIFQKTIISSLIVLFEELLQTQSEQWNAWYEAQSLEKFELSLTSHVDIPKKQEEGFLKEFYDQDFLTSFQQFGNKIIQAHEQPSFRFEFLSELLSTTEFLIKAIKTSLKETHKKCLDLFYRSLNAMLHKEIRWTARRFKDWSDGIQLITEGLKNGFKQSHLDSEFQRLLTIYEAYFNIDDKESSVDKDLKIVIEEPPSKIDEGVWTLFVAELDHHIQSIEDIILSLESQGIQESLIQSLMRSAHSLKGACKVVGFQLFVKLAHVLEDYFTQCQKSSSTLSSDDVDQILMSLDCFKNLKVSPEEQKMRGQLEELIAFFSEGGGKKKQKEKPLVVSPSLSKAPLVPSKSIESEETVKVKTELLTEMIHVSGELLVSVKSIPWKSSLIDLKQTIMGLEKSIGHLVQKISYGKAAIDSDEVMILHKSLRRLSWSLTEKIEKADLYQSHSQSLSEKLHHLGVSSRLCTFSTGIKGFPRMMRDLSKSLDKKINLCIEGESTLVDREILEALEAPLTHLLRNAADHGIESSSQRIRVGKQETGQIILKSYHQNGRLMMSVQDDGKGIIWEKLKQKVIEKGFASGPSFDLLSEREKADFIFLPGFSTAEKTTEISGRGVGLDVVKKTIEELEGNISIISQEGKGTEFLMELPITRSVLNVLLVEVGGEPYAFGLNFIETIGTFSRSSMKRNGAYVNVAYLDGYVGVAKGWELLELPLSAPEKDCAHLVFIRDHQDVFALEVERFLGETEVVIQKFSPFISCLSHVNSGAVLENGDSVFVFDMQQLRTSLRRYFSSQSGSVVKQVGCKTVLIVEDSATIRKEAVDLIKGMGFYVIQAVNGVDGWNCLKKQQVHLIVTDIDMPQMNGIDLLERVQKDSHLKKIPKIVVSSRQERAIEDKLKELGAKKLLGKESIKDGSLKECILDVVGDVILVSK